MRCKCIGIPLRSSTFVIRPFWITDQMALGGPEQEALRYRVVSAGYPATTGVGGDAQSSRSMRRTK
jgi:hypothetical protein